MRFPGQIRLSLFEAVCHDPMTATAVMTVVATGVQAASTIAQGNAAKEAASYQAAQYQQQAGQARATAQRQAIEEQRKGAFALSRAQAVAASSGAGATDPTVENIEGDLAGQSEYNQLTALFNGEERARGLTQQADTAIYEGRQAKRASIYKAVGTVAQGGETLYSKYGSWDQPDSAPSAFDANNPYGPSNLPWQNAPGYTIPSY